MSGLGRAALLSAAVGLLILGLDPQTIWPVIGTVGVVTLAYVLGLTADK